MLINRFGIWFKPRAVIGVSNLQLFANTERGKYLQFSLYFQNDTNLSCVLMANTDEFEEITSKVVRFRGSGGHEDVAVNINSYGAHVRFEPRVIQIVDRLNKEIENIFNSVEA